MNKQKQIYTETYIITFAICKKQKQEMKKILVFFFYDFTKRIVGNIFRLIAPLRTSYILC